MEDQAQEVGGDGSTHSHQILFPPPRAVVTDTGLLSSVPAQELVQIGVDQSGPPGLHTGKGTFILLPQVDLWQETSSNFTGPAGYSDGHFDAAVLCVEPWGSLGLVLRNKNEDNKRRGEE